MTREPSLTLRALGALDRWLPRAHPHHLACRAYGHVYDDNGAAVTGMRAGWAATRAWCSRCEVPLRVGGFGTLPGDTVPWEPKGARR